MDYHLKRFALILILISSTIIHSNAEKVDLIKVSESFFKKWSCLNGEDGIDCSSKDIEKIDSPLMFGSGNAIKFAYNKISDLIETLSDKGNVIKVDFSMNKLGSILETVFSRLTAVEEINLSHNQLWEFDSETFSSMTNLKSLDLSFNSISMLNREIFSKSQRLTKLYLNKNNFYIIGEDTFEHLTDLEELDLSDNRLIELPENVFRYNLKLRTLLLSGNQFMKIPTDGLKDIPNLYLLDLSRNRFVRLRHPAFDKLSKITVLRLDGQNDLRSIGPHTFQGMDRLTYFYASDNKNLRFIDAKAFYDNKTDQPLQLSSFVFRHNSVTTLSRQFLDWSKVLSIDIAGNPWNCDCNLDWMIELGMSDEQKAKVNCDHPLYLKGRSVFNLTSDQFKCSFLFNHEFTIIGTILLIITISMIMVVFLYIVVKLLPCSRFRNPFRKNYGYSKVKVSRKGKNYDLEWDPALGDPQ